MVRALSCAEPGIVSTIELRREGMYTHIYRKCPFATARYMQFLHWGAGRN